MYVFTLYLPLIKRLKSYKCVEKLKGCYKTTLIFYKASRHLKYHLMYSKPKVATITSRLLMIAICPKKIQLISISVKVLLEIMVVK